MSESDALKNAVIGAVVTIVTSFLPLSPLLGGATAGYLQGGDRREGARVGAISGGISLLPLLFFAFLALLFLFGAAPAEGAVAFSVLLFVFAAVLVAYSVGLGALGGYLGVYVLEETGGRPRDGGSVVREFPGEMRSRDERWGDDGRSTDRADRDGRSDQRVDRDDRPGGWSRDDEREFDRETDRGDEY